MQIGIITLGCDKNTVDNEYLAGLLVRHGHGVFRPDQRATNRAHERMDALIITTCGFIRDATQESIDTIVDWAEYRKRSGEAFRIIVIGCLAQLHASELVREIPEIDAIAGVANPEHYVRLIESSLPSRRVPAKPSLAIKTYYPRKALDSLPYGFLRIADGCNYRCTFCAIPRMKGSYRSVPHGVVLREAQALLRRGIREISVIGQDITKYGSDLDAAGSDLVGLLEALCRLRGKFWVRLLYLYPTGLTRRLIEFVRDEPKMCKYFDIPLQHVVPRILRLMRRPTDISQTFRTLERLRRLIPGVTIRTTMLVGFPGETEAEFDELCRAVTQFQFDRLGVFAFSAEPGTRAATLPDQIPARLRMRRRNHLMRIQSRISHGLNSRAIGTLKEVLIESRIKGTDLYLSRSQGEAPEVDGAIIVQSRHHFEPGNFVSVRITAASEYDLLAEPC